MISETRVDGSFNTDFNKSRTGTEEFKNPECLSKLNVYMTIREV